MKKTALIVLSIILLFSCTGSRKIIVKVWTNKTDFPFYAELYNKSQDRYRVEAIYVDSIPYELNKSESIPDIVFGYYLNSFNTINYFQGLDSLFYHEKKNPSGVRTDDMYQDLLALCLNNSSTVLLPVSFNLPALVHLNGMDLPFVSSPDDIRDICSEFNSSGKGKMGFSSVWTAKSVLISLSNSGFCFSEDNSQELVWDDSKFIVDIKSILEWESGLNGSYSEILDFKKQYYNAPSYKLLEDKRILFDIISLRDFYSIPSDKRKQLDLTWLGSNGKIPVLEDILFTGIHKHAYNSKGARDFIKWFFLPETQISLIKESQIQQITGFGILGGLSPLKQINELEIHQLYSDLVGNIPAEQNLAFPCILPTFWSEVKSFVIFPWIEDYMNNTSGLKTLPEVYRTWKIQHFED